jgi:hypothetical protein
LRPIDGAAFAVFESAIASPQVAGEDSQSLYGTGHGVDSEGVVTHAESAIGGCELLQSLRNINTLRSCSVIGARDLVLAGGAGPDPQLPPQISRKKKPFRGKPKGSSKCSNPGGLDANYVARLEALGAF